MSCNDTKEEILKIANSGEVGGGHDQKGGNFQRHWAIMRMFELESSGADDFLILFEAIQDIAELDSVSDPKTMRIYQAKKKEGSYWSWNELTKYKNANGKSKSSAFSKQTPDIISESIIGKLYASVIAFNNIGSSGFFISNSGCDLPLVNAGNATSYEECCLSDIAEPHLELLKSGLASLHKDSKLIPDPSRIMIKRVDIPPNDPGPYLRGKVADYLSIKSPRNVSQARALMDALLANISHLCAKTDRHSTFEEMCKARGFSRYDLRQALNNLEPLPDEQQLLEDYLRQMIDEKMDLRTISGIRTVAARFKRSKLTNLIREDEIRLTHDCDDWLNNNEFVIPLVPLLERAYDVLKLKHSLFRAHEIFAFLIMRAIQTCEDRI